MFSKYESTSELETTKMKYLITVLSVFLAFNSVAQKNTIYSTYINTFTDYIGQDNCCRLIEVFRLNKDHTFNLFQKNDQGDYKTERFSYGQYKIVGDSVLFIPKYDSRKKINDPKQFFEYSGYKMRILDSCLETLVPIVFIAGGKVEKIKYCKANFNDFDSLKITVDKYDSATWYREYLFVKKDKIVINAFSSFNLKTKKTIGGQREFQLSVKQYNLFIKKLSESPVIELPSKTTRNEYRINLYLKNNNFNNQGDFFSENLYDFLFTTLLKSPALAQE